jgi:hypothetical protein
MNFIALGVIAEIDNFYLQALPSSALKTRLGEPTPIKTTSRDFEKKERDCKSKWVRVTYRFFRVIEVAFYFYFTPFTVIFLNLYFLR